MKKTHDISKRELNLMEIKKEEDSQVFRVERQYFYPAEHICAKLSSQPSARLSELRGTFFEQEEPESG